MGTWLAMVASPQPAMSKAGQALAGACAPMTDPDVVLMSCGRGVRMRCRLASWLEPGRPQIVSLYGSLAHVSPVRAIPPPLPVITPVTLPSQCRAGRLPDPAAQPRLGMTHARWLHCSTGLLQHYPLQDSSNSPSCSIKRHILATSPATPLCCPSLACRSITHHTVAAADGTRKFLLQLADGRVVETVGIPNDESAEVDGGNATEAQLAASRREASKGASSSGRRPQSACCGMCAKQAPALAVQ